MPPCLCSPLPLALALASCVCQVRAMRNELDALRKELAERLEKDPRKVANLRMQLREFNATSAQYEVRAMPGTPPLARHPPCLAHPLLPSRATIRC